MAINAPEANMSSEIGEQTQVVDVQTFYETELEKLRVEQSKPEERALKFLEKKAAATKPWYYKYPEQEYKSRPLSLADKVRRQALFLQARIEGVKDLNRFGQLVDYFESTVTEREEVWLKLPKGLTEEQKTQISEKWKAKGYPLNHYFHEYDKYTNFSPARDVPLKIKREYVKSLKNLTSSQNNPLEITEGLRKIGFRFTDYTLNSPEKMKQLAKLFSAPNVKKALDLVQGIQHWSDEWFHSDFAYRTKKASISQIDFLIQLANAAKPNEILPEEMIHKINAISGAIKQRVGADEIQKFTRIATNPDYLDFVTLIPSERHTTSREELPVFENIVALDEAGVLTPLATLIRAGVSLGEDDLKLLFDSYEAQYSTEEVRTKVINNLRAQLSTPEIQTFLQDPKQQEFAALISHQTNSQLPFDKLKSFVFGPGNSKKAEALYLISLLYGDQDWTGYSNLEQLQAITFITFEPRLLETFTRKDFAEFLSKLKTIGYRVSARDAFENGDSVLAGVFNNPEIQEQLFKEKTLEVLKVFYPEGNFSIDKAHYFVQLAGIPNIMEVISSLQNVGYSLKPDQYNYSGRNLPDVETLEKLSQSQETIRKFASPEAKDLAERLRDQFGWKTNLYDLDLFSELFDNRDQQQELFEPGNVEYIKKIKPYDLYRLKDIEPMLEVDPPTRRLLIQLRERFGFTPDFGWGGLQGKEVFAKLLQDETFRTKLLSDQAVEVYQKIRKSFYFYHLGPQDFEVIANAPSDFAEFITEIKTKYNYEFQNKDLMSLLQLAANREKFSEILDVLKEYGYQFKVGDISFIAVLVPEVDKTPNLLSTIRNLTLNYGISFDPEGGSPKYEFRAQDAVHLVRILPYIDRLSEAVITLKEVFEGYTFNVGSSQTLTFILENNLSKERLLELKGIYNQFRAEFPGEFSIGTISTALSLERITRFVPRLLDPNYATARSLVIHHGETLLKSEADIEFLNRTLASLGERSADFLEVYLEKRSVVEEKRGAILESYKDIFLPASTDFSLERLEAFNAASKSKFGQALVDIIRDSSERNMMLLDFACFTERLETNKTSLLVTMLRNDSNSSEFKRAFELLRWLPDAVISSQDTLESLESKFKESQEKLSLGFQRIFPNTEQLLNSYKNVSNLQQQLFQICKRFNFEVRNTVIDGYHVSLPKGFIREFNDVKRQKGDAQFIPELASYLIREISKKSSAYTVEDLMLSQIGDTADTTGRRRGRYAAEQLLEVMEHNIEASLFTWTTAIGYQQEKADSPLFLIANERTGPADLAAEYLPKEFAERFKINQAMDYDRVFDWFRDNEDLIEQLYDQFQTGVDVQDKIPSEIKSLLGVENNSLIPIYRLKIPSSLDAASQEPEGIDTILNFLKLASTLGGRTLFMDESTRTAPRSIECLYNVINRRQEKLGGARIRLFGKINGVKGQSGTLLNEFNPDNAHLEIGFVDPWHSETKSVTDDSSGFVPQITGSGIIEIIQPSYTSISPYGISTMQDLWKQFIANEVSLRYAGFTESGGAKKRKEEFKPTKDPNDEILTQDELKEKAFQKPYKALIIDLDGTIGTRGEYNPKIIARIKDLADQGVGIVIATARSIVDNPEYSGSVSSFIQQLGELSETQKSHIHLATENGAIISTVGNLESPHEAHFMSADIADSLKSLIATILPETQTFTEQASLVIRNFADDKRQEIIEKLREQIERFNLPVKVTSDTKRSIQIRVGNATKRNVLNWLEGRGISVNDIAKIGDSPEGNDRPIFWGRGSFNVGRDGGGTLWTIHMDENGGGPIEVEQLLERLEFTTS